MTPLQLQIMQRADKTLSFGCIVEKGIYLGQNDEISHHVLSPESEEYYADVRLYGSTIKGGYDPGVIGHPYGFERLIYLYEISPISDKMVDAMANIDIYIYR